MDRKKFQQLYTGVGRAIKHALWKYKEANSTLWVSSLCYYTVLSLVPVFALFFSIGSFLGLGEYLLKQIDSHSPLKGDVIKLIVTFSDNLLTNARSGILAGLGFIFLMWTLITMFSIIEKSFNDIWDVETTRSFVRKISDYLTFFILLPSLILLSNASTILAQQKILGEILPHLSLLLFFMALFMVMPNTEVKPLPAFVASFCTSVMFSIFQHVFIYLQVLINTYNKIYGSFSVIFIFLIWLRITWFLIILGAHLSYLLQNRDVDIHFSGLNADSLSFFSKYSLAISILQEMVFRYQNMEPLVSRNVLVEKFQSSVAVDGVLRILKRGHFILEGMNEKQEKIYSLQKNIEKTKLEEVYFAVASYGKAIASISFINVDVQKLDMYLSDLGKWRGKE